MAHWNEKLGAFTATKRLKVLLGNLNSAKRLGQILGDFSEAENLKTYLSPYSVFYPFNHPSAAVDPDYWSEGGDSGGFIVETGDLVPPSRRLYADTLVDNDYYVHGDGKYNKLWNVLAGEYSTVVFKTRLKFATTTDVQALWGLFKVGSFPTDYSEPAIVCAHFFLDDGINPNFVCRSVRTAEGETPSNVPLDNSFHSYTIIWTTSSVTFLIDDVIKATHTDETHIPASPLGMVFLLRTQAAAIRSVSVEYAKVYVGSSE